MTDTSVLWLTPDKPDNISVGRQRIALHLETTGHDVVLRATTPTTVVRSLLDGGRFDAVVGTTRLGAIAGLLVSRRHGIPFVVDHVDPIRQLRETTPAPVVSVVKRLENIAFRLADHVLYVYDEERPRIASRASASTKTDLGVDFDRFADPSEGARERARDRLPDQDTNVAIYIGGLEPMYHIESMLEAMVHTDDWTLVVAGAGSLGPEVKAAASESSSIQFLGTVDHADIPGYLHAADVGLSLVDDPHTLKILEYGAASLPVVQLDGRAVSRFGGLVEYTTSSPRDIAAAIERAGQHGSEAGLQQHVSKFTWRDIGKTYQRVIESVTTRRST